MTRAYKHTQSKHKVAHNKKCNWSDFHLKRSIYVIRVKYIACKCESIITVISIQINAHARTHQHTARKSAAIKPEMQTQFATHAVSMMTLLCQLSNLNWVMKSISHAHTQRTPSRYNHELNDRLRPLLLHFLRLNTLGSCSFYEKERGGETEEFTFNAKMISEKTAHSKRANRREKKKNTKRFQCSEWVRVSM